MPQMHDILFVQITKNILYVFSLTSWTYVLNESMLKSMHIKEDRCHKSVMISHEPRINSLMKHVMTFLVWYL